MKQSFYKTFFLAFFFAFCLYSQLPAATVQNAKMLNLATEFLSLTFTTPYNPNYADNKFAADLIYPVANFGLNFTLSIPEIPKLSKKEKNTLESEFISAIFKLNNNEMLVHFDKFAKGPLAKAEKVFFATDQNPSSKTSLSKRSAALKTLNSEFVKAITSFEDSKPFKSLLQNIKAQVAKINPKALVTHSFMINELTLPPKNKTGFSSLFAKNVDRAKIIALLPRFSMFNDNEKTLWAKIPQIVYMDFPCNYLVSPKQPEIKALIKVPHNLGDMIFFDVSHSFPYNFWINERAADILDSNSKASFYKKINDNVQTYAKKLFDESKPITKEEFLKFQKKLNDVLIDHKASFTKKIKEGIDQAAPTLKNSKAAATFGPVAENEFTLPESSTGFSLIPPDEIDLDEDVSKSELQTKTDKLLVEYKALRTELKNYYKICQQHALDFKKLLQDKKTISNAGFKKILDSDAKLSAAFAKVLMKDAAKAGKYINLRERFKKFIDLAASLYTCSDILAYREKNTAAASSIKEALMMARQLIDYWNDARVLSYDKPSYFERFALELARKGKNTDEDAFRYFYSQIFSLCGEYETCSTKLEGADLSDFIKAEFAKAMNVLK